MKFGEGAGFPADSPEISVSKWDDHNQPSFCPEEVSYLQRSLFEVIRTPAQYSDGQDNKLLVPLESSREYCGLICSIVPCNHYALYLDVPQEGHALMDGAFGKSETMGDYSRLAVRR